MKALTTSLTARVAAYAAAGATAVTGVATTNAALVYVDPPDITVPNTLDGIYINLVTGATGTTSGTTPGYDINPYAQSSGFAFFGPSATTGYVGAAGAGPAALTLGTLIGSTSTFLTGTQAAPAYRVTGTELLGVRFLNEATGATNYGWLEFTTTAALGFPATLTRYAYDNTGLPVAAGVVPEPGSIAAMAALGLGAAGLRAWRRRKQA